MCACAQSGPGDQTPPGSRLRHTRTSGLPRSGPSFAPAQVCKGGLSVGSSPARPTAVPGQQPAPRGPMRGCPTLMVHPSSPSKTTQAGSGWFSVASLEWWTHSSSLHDQERRTLTRVAVQRAIVQITMLLSGMASASTGETSIGCSLQFSTMHLQSSNDCGGLKAHGS